MITRGKVPLQIIQGIVRNSRSMKVLVTFVKLIILCFLSRISVCLLLLSMMAVVAISVSNTVLLYTVKGVRMDTVQWTSDRDAKSSLVIYIVRLWRIITQYKSPEEFPMMTSNARSVVKTIYWRTVDVWVGWIPSRRIVTELM